MPNLYKSESGFTLVEILIYVAIFTASSIFLVGILTVVTRTQARQSAVNEVNGQLSFAANIIQRTVQSASSIENDVGVTSDTLNLRMQSSSEDTVKIFTDPSSKTLYLETIPDGSVSGERVAITNGRVRVSNFSVIRQENEGGISVVQVDLGIDSLGQNQQNTVSRFWRGAISRVSAATFDSNLLPSGSFLNLGVSGSPTWEKLFLGDGSVASPSFTFGNDTGMGLFRSGTGLGISVGGTQKATFTSTGLSISGSIIVSDLSGVEGKAICAKSDGTFGRCSNQPNASGVCTCN